MSENIFCTQCHVMRLGLRRMKLKEKKRIREWDFYNQRWVTRTKVVYKCNNNHKISWTLGD